jgi:hypothetical protein
MKLIFPSATIDIDLLPVPISEVYQRIYRNLQHVPVPFSAWDNPFCTIDPTVGLIKHAQALGIAITPEPHTQEYLNSLHQIFEKNYDGNPAWLPFHEHIHLVEQHTRPKTLTIDYREKSGMLHQPFELAWLQQSQTQVQAGDVYVEWAELGKIPYEYWQDCEPNNISRMCELAKPWQVLRPKIHVAFEDIDFLANKRTQEFQSWWAEYHDYWCAHWRVPEWHIKDMYSVLVFGNINAQSLDHLQSLLQAGQDPIQVRL